MEKIRIVTDSASDIIELSGMDFLYTPMKIITAEREFVDNRELDTEEMVKYLSKYKGKSKSSCPNVAEWLDAFGDAKFVICVTITSGLSGSFNSACAAAQQYMSEGRGEVFVVDSLSAGPEITLIVRKIAELIKEGLSFAEVCERAEEYKTGTGLVFMLKSVKNFANNGRISPLVAKLVGIAGICIVGRASEVGTLEPMQKCRGERRALVAITEELQSRGVRGGKISIGHCNNEQGANTLLGMLREKFPEADIDIHPMRGLCCFYAEDGGLLVGYEKR